MYQNNNCLNHVLGRLDPKTFLSVYPHCTAPCHNLHSRSSEQELNDFEQLSRYFTKLPWQISCPVPVSHPSVIERNVINGTDPALQLVKSKKHWEDCKNSILRYCNEEDSEIKAGRSSKITVEVPQNVMLLTHHLRKDPDLHFNANYNSYFNKSNITSLDAGLEKFLIRPQTHGKGDIVLSKINLNEKPCDIDEYNVTSSTEIPGFIYEINAEKNIIVTRQKQNITLFALESEENEHSITKKLMVKNDCPFVSICTNGISMCALSAERELQIFDLAVGRQVFREKFFNDTIMSDNWGSIFYINNNTLSYLDRSSCAVVDLRVKNEVKKWHINEFTEHCEEIYTGGVGINELQYVVTNHQIFSLDLRAGFSQRWTHCIGHSPVVMSVLSTSTIYDMLFIGSQRNDTVVLIENDRAGNKVCSKVVPYALPSLRETLHLAQYNGYCLSNTVQSRFEMSLTGLCAIDNRDEITLFSITSIGDVFKQTLKKYSDISEPELNENELNKLESWEEECEDLLLEINNPCYVTDLLDDTHILQCVQENKKMYEEPSTKMENCRAEWNISKKELQSYCDYLAPRIVEEWGIDLDEEWCQFTERTLDELSSDEEDNVTERVMKWIEKYAGEMASNPVVDADDIGEESKVQQENPPAIMESEIHLKPDISLIEPSSLENKVPILTPKKKFISGF